MAFSGTRPTSRGVHRGRSLAAPVSITILLGVLALLFGGQGQAAAGLRPVPPGRLVAETTVGHPIADGESFGSILAGYGVDPAEVARWYRAAQSVLDLSWIRSGRTLTLEFDDERKLGSLRYPVDEGQQVVVHRRDDELVARREPTPTTVRVVGRRGVVFTSVHAAARTAGIPDSIVSQMVDVLGDRIDFGSAVRPGDRFRILYEERTSASGSPLPPGRMLAADYLGQQRSASAFLFEDEAAEPTYLDADGRALGNDFLRYPVEFTRITSTFSDSRLHPVLRTRRPHLGVDFAAPVGTPVRAVGPGRIGSAGWKGTFGRHIEIDHGDGLVSTYSHLQSIHPLVREHGTVERGQILGTVGQSGLATGPHLHFAMFEHGFYLNPLEVHDVIAAPSVDAARFAEVRSSFMERLQGVLAENLGSKSSTPPVYLSSLTQAGQLGPLALTL